MITSRRGGLSIQAYLFFQTVPLKDVRTVVLTRFDLSPAPLSTNTHFHYSDLSLTLFWITHWAYILELSADKLHKGHSGLKSEIRDKSGCVSPASILNYMHLLIHNRFMVWLALKFLSVKCQIETITMDKIRLL